MLRPAFGLLLASALLLAACGSGDDGRSDGDLTSPTPAATAVDESETETDAGPAEDPRNFAATLEDPNSDARAIVTQACIESDTGTVTMKISGFTDVDAGEVVNAKVGRQTVPVQVSADGSGLQIRQGTLSEPTKVSIPLPAGGALETEVPGCSS